MSAAIIQGVPWTPQTVAVWQTWTFGQYRCRKYQWHGPWHFEDDGGAIYSDESLQDVMLFASQYIARKAAKAPANTPEDA